MFGTLHTQSAPSTIDRIIDVFPAEQQEQVRIQIASSLQGVVTQALLPTADGVGRVPALEVLLPDDAVRNLIRQGKVEQVYSVMQTNTSRGMQTMEQSLSDLIQQRVVDLEVGLSRSSRPQQLIGLLERAGFPVELPQDLGDPFGHDAAARRRPEGRRELTMDDNSIWKKEISFGRKPRRRTTRASRRQRRAVRARVQAGALARSEQKADALEAGRVADAPRAAGRRTSSSGRRCRAKTKWWRPSRSSPSAATDEVAPDRRGRPAEQISDAEPEPARMQPGRSRAAFAAGRTSTSAEPPSSSRLRAEPEEHVWTREVSFSRAPDEPSAEPSRSPRAGARGSAAKSLVSRAPEAELPSAEAVDEPVPTSAPEPSTLRARASRPSSVEPWGAPPVTAARACREPVADEPAPASGPEPLPAEVAAAGCRVPT